VLLIEQNAELAFELCTRAYVLENGRIVASGSAADLQRSEAVRRAYLGGSVLLEGQPHTRGGPE